MAKKPTFESLFDAAATEFEAAFKRSAPSARPDEIGGPREQQVRDFLTEWLPLIYGITHGYVIDIAGSISRQCDVLLYDALRTPRFFQDRATGRQLVPLGSLYGTIEVKSALDEKEFRDALDKLKAVSALQFVPDEYYHEPPEKLEEREVLALEIERKPNPWGHTYKAPTRHAGRHRYVSDDAWGHYRVKVLPKDVAPSEPIGLIFAYKFAKGFSFEKAQGVIKEVDFAPDGLVVLNDGFSVAFDPAALKRHKSLQEGKPLSAYQYDTDILRAQMKGMSDGSSSITNETVEARYTLLFFYTYLLDLLGRQRLAQTPPTDFIAVWRKQRDE